MENYRGPMHGLDRQTLWQLSLRSDARGGGYLALHALVLGATSGLVWASRATVAFIPAMVIHGFVLDCLYCALHATSHRTAFASRHLNERVAWICGALMLLPVGYFRSLHVVRHQSRHDLMRHSETPQDRPTVASRLWHISGLRDWQQRLGSLVRHAVTGRVTEPFIPTAKRRQIVREARWVCGVYLEVLVLSLAFGSDAAVVYWLLPAVAGQPLLRRYLRFSASAHRGVDAAPPDPGTGGVAALLRRLSWQMEYRTLHREFPSIPFHALPALHERLRLNPPSQD